MIHWSSIIIHITLYQFYISLIPKQSHFIVNYIFIIYFNSLKFSHIIDFDRIHSDFLPLCPVSSSNTSPTHIVMKYFLKITWVQLPASIYTSMQEINCSIGNLPRVISLGKVTLLSSAVTTCQLGMRILQFLPKRCYLNKISTFYSVQFLYR